MIRRWQLPSQANGANAMGPVAAGLSVEQRARLAHKGRLLYGKSCGTGGTGTCAETFALYHVWKGEAEVARDLLAFLETRLAALREHDPDGKLAMTEELASRLRRHLESEADDPPDPSRWAAILKEKKQRPGVATTVGPALTLTRSASEGSDHNPVADASG
jgi:hypothetical protein